MTILIHALISVLRKFLPNPRSLVTTDRVGRSESLKGDRSQDPEATFARTTQVLCLHGRNRICKYSYSKVVYIVQ